MKRLAFAVGISAIGFLVSPAHADYALVRFEEGRCRIWWDSAGTPGGGGGTKMAIGMPVGLPAWAALRKARSQGVCRYPPARASFPHPPLPALHALRFASFAGMSGCGCANYGSTAA